MPTRTPSANSSVRPKTRLKSSRRDPDPFSSPLSVFENEILFLLSGKSLNAARLRSDLRAYGETELSEWCHLEVALPSTLAKLEDQGWVACRGEKYTLTSQAQAFVGAAEVEP